jgi:hypothetical protein
MDGQRFEVIAAKDPAIARRFAVNMCELHISSQLSLNISEICLNLNVSREKNLDKSSTCFVGLKEC